MTQTTIERKNYKGTKDYDYLERARVLDTAKKVSDVDFQCQNLNSGNTTCVLKILKGENEIDLEKLSVPEFRKILAQYVLDLKIEHTKEMKDTTTMLSDIVVMTARIA